MSTTTIDAITSIEQNGCSLNNLELSVQFHGVVYRRDVPKHIPVKITVHLADEWATILPIVHDISVEKLAANEPLEPVVLPFLPLSSHFRPDDMCHWQQLVQQLENCLVADPFLDVKHPKCYRLMRELFWMAFVAAHPQFPGGEWPRWNPLIPMEGDFITQWMMRDDSEDKVSDMPLYLVIWEQFRSIACDASLVPFQVVQ